MLAHRPAAAAAGELSVNAAGVVRYLYGVPVGLLLLLGYGAATGVGLPELTAWALLLCALGGFAQILGTNLLIMAFGHRNFAAGTAYAKTEAVQAAVIGVLLLGENLAALSWLGIAIGVGVLYLSLAGRGTSPSEMLRGITQPAALCGIGAGFCFAFTSVMIRAANQDMPGDALIHKALLLLVVTNSLQTLMQGSWLVWRSPPRSVRSSPVGAARRRWGRCRRWARPAGSPLSRWRRWRWCGRWGRWRSCSPSPSAASS